MAYKEKDLRPFVKMIVEEEGSINTTELNLRLREILSLSEEDLEILDNRNDDRFSQTVRNLVRYKPKEGDIFESHGYLVDKSKKPAVFFAKNYATNENIEAYLISEEEENYRKERKRSFIAKKIDYQKLNEENSSLGFYGEQFVINYEKERLKRLNVSFDTDIEVVHVSELQGDGAGYDVLSKKDEKGDPLYIEVKTTKGSIDTPFYLSINELYFLEEFRDHAIIYRLFNYDTTSETFELYTVRYSDLVDNFTLDPINYKVSSKLNNH